MKPKTNEFYSGNAFYEQGIMKSWKKVMMVIDLEQKTLQVQGLDDTTYKRDYDLTKYQVKNLERYQNKWSIQLIGTQREHKFGWNNEKDYKEWLECFKGEWLAKQRKKQLLEEFDKQVPEVEPSIDHQRQLQAKPSIQSREKIKQMITCLPEFIQKDMEILLQNTLQNLDGFSDIQHFKHILDQENTKLYQDPNDSLHMKLVYYSKFEPRTIYDEQIMPSTSNCLPHYLKQFQVFPTKKGCSLVFLELEFAGELAVRRSKTEREEIKENQFCQSLNTVQNEDDIIKMVFTQKGFEKDGIYCVFRKYTGQEIYHDQIDSSLISDLEKCKIVRSALVIQPTTKENFKSQIIEEIYAECKDADAGEKMLKLLLLNITQRDRYLIQIQEEIKQRTSNVITKDFGNFDTIQISFRFNNELTRVTSEQHQVQSKDEFQKIIEKVENGAYITDSIFNKYSLGVVDGLDAQLQTNENDGHFLYTKYYKVDQQKGGLTYHNERLLTDQRNVIFDMIRRMGSNFINGRSVMSVSLPIQIFESRSFLERMARALGHAPLFLESAAKSNDPMYQMKQSIAFNFASFMMGIQQEKPFNPIIGETFQGRILGCPVYLEQTSHHPPISNYIMYGREYKIYGAFSPIVNMGLNSLSGEQHGHQIIQFNNVKFYYINQPFTVYNIVTGQRNVNCHKRSFCFQPELQLCAVIQFNPKDKCKSIFSSRTRPIDYFEGNIYKVTRMFIEKCKNAHKTGKGDSLKLKITKEDILQTFDKISGRWTSHLNIDNQLYWDVSAHQPYILELEPNPLPSDCLYRMDLLLMKKKEIQRAQEMKEQMEVFQRNDQKLRKRRS